MLLAIQVKWAKTKAHANRWDEEFILTIEEMCQTIAFLHWKAEWWMQCAYAHGNVSMALTSGLSACMHKQATVYKGLAHSFSSKWYLLLVAHSIPIKWPPAYIPKSGSSNDSTYVIIIYLYLTVKVALYLRSLTCPLMYFIHVFYYMQLH